jgi:BirA family biotin operon repressor/biotin-[acetyl-CoA-carboxylase] ligase
MNTIPFIGRRIERHAVVESTNDIVRAAAQRGEPEGFVVTAEEQLAGRGRFGRKWIVPRGTSLQISVLLRPPLAPSATARVVRMAALALCETLVNHLQLAPTLKWPNDVYLNGRKVAGILLESSIRGDAVEYVILGIGLNVNYTMRVYPELAPYATTLQDVLGHEIDRSPLEDALLNALNTQYRALLFGDDLLDEYRARLDMLGKPIQVATPGGTVRGIAQAVTDDGALVISTDKANISVYAGDVTVLKESSAEAAHS